MQSPSTVIARQTSRLRALFSELVALPEEPEWLEFKLNNSDPEMVGIRISALSNAARLHDKEFGYLIWGVKDGSHEVVGTSFNPNGKIGNQPYKFVIESKLAPAPQCTYINYDIDKKNVIILQISAADELPVSWNRIPYIRIGSATPPLRDFTEIEKRLLSKLKSFVWETGSAAGFLTSGEVLDLLDTGAFLRLRNMSRPTTVQALLEKLQDAQMIDRDVGGRWNILNLGAILLAKNLHSFPALERKALRIIQYLGHNRVQAKPEQEWTQGYAVGFETTLRFLKGILPATETIGVVRAAENIYPSEAVKELLANTLIHQDMTITGTGPKVEIFDDRIEFNNPGEPVTDWKKLFGAEPRSRNERLALAMRHMDLCEERGSGLRRTLESTNAAHLLPPEFHGAGGSARVVLHGHRQDFDAMDQNTKIRAIFYYAMILHEQNKRLTNSGLRTRFPMSGNATVKASAVLRRGVEAGVLKIADPQRPNSGYAPFWA